MPTAERMKVRLANLLVRGLRLLTNWPPCQAMPWHHDGAHVITEYNRRCVWCEQEFPKDADR